jgi:hypothetical protein
MKEHDTIRGRDVMFLNCRGHVPLHYLTLTVLLVVAGTTVSAGTMSLAWDPVSHPDLVGYRLYYGTSPGSYPQSLDLGTDTAATLAGLQDCTTYHVAVKARTSDGSESDVFSNEVSGWSRPEPLSVSPGTIERGSTLEVTLFGINFQDGAVVTFTDPNIAVNRITVFGCDRIAVNVTVGVTAALGTSDLLVINPDQVFGAGSGLFSILEQPADEDGPVIGETAAGVVGATTATVTWTTDEPATSQVLFRRVGEASYQQSPIDSALITDHAVTLSGLMPDTDYEFHVTSADAAGNVSVSVDQPFRTLANGFTYIRFEAETGRIEAPLQRVGGSNAFRGEWVTLPAGEPSGTPDNPNGTVEYGFHVPESGEWFTWFRMYGPAFNADSFFEAVDGAQFDRFFPGQVGAWVWVAARSYSLDEGLHTLVIGGREAQARLDRILITNDPSFEPSEQPTADVTPPAPAADLQVDAGDAAATLHWIDPTDGDVERIVVRYRDDGQAPLSPADGLPLADLAPTGGSRSLEHPGLTNGTTYHYGVFAVDVSGNASDAAVTEGTPESPTIPVGQVQNLHRTDQLSE